jgi:hypothetical protein
MAKTPAVINVRMDDASRDIIDAWFKHLSSSPPPGYLRVTLSDAIRDLIVRAGDIPEVKKTRKA